MLSSAVFPAKEQLNLLFDSSRKGRAERGIGMIMESSGCLPHVMQLFGVSSAIAAHEKMQAQLKPHQQRQAFIHALGQETSSLPAFRR